MANYAKGDGGYRLPAITDPDRICIQLEIPNDPEHKAAFWGALWTLTWYNAWQKDDEKRGREVGAVWRDVWFKAREANVDWDACVNCDEDGCVEMSPQFIQEWYPNNPYISVPEGMVKKWYIAPEINLLGVPAGTVVTDILNTQPGGDGDFIRCRFSFSGTGTAEIHWHTVNLGGLAQVQVDSDITKIYYVELASDLTAAPPEPTTGLITEYEFDTPGQHHIDITMLPQLNTDIEAIGYGGGIVKIVMCGFDNMIITPKFRFTEACGLEQSNDNGVTWETVEGWDTYAASCFTGPAGENGEDGPPIELRTYFGTVQWRVVGDPVWQHLANLSDFCDCDEPEPANPNPISEGLVCAISQRIAQAIRTSWVRAFENPELLDGVITGENSLPDVNALLWPSLAFVTAGINLLGNFVNSMTNVFVNAEANAFNDDVEDYVASLIYCELIRREQLTIDRDVILDIAPNLQNAPDLTDAQKEALIALTLAVPQLLLTSTAMLALPLESGATCESVCPDDTEAYWCFNFFSDSAEYDGLMAAHPLISSGLTNLQIGRLETEGTPAYIAQSRTGYPFLPDAGDAYPSREIRIIVTFPRPTLVDGLSIDIFYNQTNDVASGRLVRIVSDDGTVLMSHDASGITGADTSVSFEWWGEKVVKSLTITGQIWATHAWADVFAKLQYTGLKIQGREYAPFKPFNNCIWQAPPPADEIPAHDWTATFNFMESDWGFTAGSGNGGVEGAYIPGLGWRTTFTDFYQFEGIVMDVGRAFAIYSGVVAFAMSYSRQNFNGDAPNIRISNPQSQVNFPNDSHGIRTDLVTYSPMNVGSGVRIRIICASVGDDSLNGTEGEAIVYQLRMYGTGTRPVGFVGIPD